MAVPLQQMIMQPTPLGEGFLACADVQLSSNYVNGTGNVISANVFGLQSLRWVQDSMITSDGVNYAVATSPAGVGAKSFVIRIFTAATGAEIGSGAMTKKFRMLAWGN